MLILLTLPKFHNAKLSSADIVTLGFVGIIVFAVLISVLFKLPEFFSARKHIKMEINRTTGKEQKYWKRQLRNTWRMFF